MSRTNRLATTLYVVGLNCTTQQSRLVGFSRRRNQFNLTVQLANHRLDDGCPSLRTGSCTTLMKNVLLQSFSIQWRPSQRSCHIHLTVRETFPFMRSIEGGRDSLSLTGSSRSN